MITSPLGLTEDRTVTDSDRESESSVVLVSRARNGDQRALEQLCSRYLPRLNRWAHGRLPAWARGALDTHDLVQDTLTHVVLRLSAFEPQHDAAFQAYLRQALMNRVRDEIRRSQRRPAPDPLDSAHPSRTASPLEEAIGQEALEEVRGGPPAAEAWRSPSDHRPD